MILHAYFARRFAMTFLIVASAFAVLVTLLDFIEHLRRFGEEEAGIGKILQLVALNVPASLYQTLPLIMVICSIMLFLNLARSSELVVTRASGRSAVRSLFGPLLTAFAIGLISVTVLNPIVAATENKHEKLAAKLLGQQVNSLSFSANGLWLRQGNETFQTVIHAKRANLDGTQLFDVALYEFDLTGKATKRMTAKSALLIDGYWSLKGVKEWLLKLGGNPEAKAIEKTSYNIKTSLTKDHIQDSFGIPASIPIWQLPSFIKKLKEAGFSARRHVVWFHMELALPLFLVAIVMIGAGFTVKQGRQVRTGLMVLLAILFGFGLYFIRNFARILGENGQLPEIWAAWIPPLAAIGLTLAFLLHTEDG
jgi:lipopolysaccharide export system permease protein